MIICKSTKTPYNANKSILGVFANWEYGYSLLYAYISRQFVFLWCTPMYIECFQCVIDKCYHYRLTSKIFDMVFAGDGLTTVLYAIEFHAMDFSNECMFMYSSMTKTHAWTYAYMNTRSYVAYMNMWTYVHIW